MSTATITPESTLGSEALEGLKSSFVKAFIAVRTAGNTLAASRNAKAAITTAKALGNSKAGFAGASFSLAMMSMRTTYKLTTAAEGNVIAFPVRLVGWGLRLTGVAFQAANLVKNDGNADTGLGKAASWFRKAADSTRDFASKLKNGYRSVMEHNAVVRTVVWSARVIGLVILANAIAGGAIATAAASVPFIGVALALLVSSPVFALFALAFLQGVAALLVMVFDSKQAFIGLTDPSVAHDAFIKDAKSEFGWLWKVVSYPFRSKTLAYETEAFLAANTPEKVDEQIREWVEERRAATETVEFISTVEYGPITEDEHRIDEATTTPVVILANQADSLDGAIAILRNGARVHYHSGITSIVAPADGDQIMAWVLSAHNAAQAKTRMNAIDSPFTRGPRVEMHKPDINIPAAASDRIMKSAGAGSKAGANRKAKAKK